jgi:predicted AAA+ superfamily ATPase
MQLDRHILTELMDWKNSSNRKPLILRGARQVGKTTVVRHFAQTYKHFIDLNLEKTDDKFFFNGNDNVRDIVDAIHIEKGLHPDWANTLLFIDEIQESPRAIHLLRYFYEELPKLHVIAAGSLLEFAMGNVKSFPVGRVSFLHMFPINFQEYMKAEGNSRALEGLKQIPVPDVAHETLMRLFHDYVIVGGMPEIVSSYVRDHSVSSLPGIYESIWATYREDVTKYASNDKERRIMRHLMDYAPFVVDQRVTFQNFGNSGYKSREVSEAFRQLDNARVVQLIYPTTNLQIPILPDLKKSPRIQFLDSGLLNHVLGIQSEMIGLADLHDAWRGAIIPHVVTQELISLSTNHYQKPVFWVRQKTQSQAEVNLVYRHGETIVPIEIKSGSKGKLRSLHQFIEKAPHGFAVRMYAGKFFVENSVTPGGEPFLLMNLPYYLGTMLPQYISWFLKEYSSPES